MRILHLNVLYPPNVQGGAERFVAALAQEQAKRGHSVAVATLTRQPEPVSEEHRVKVYRIGHGGLFWFEDWKQHSAPVRYANKMLTNWNPITLKGAGQAVVDVQPNI